jgi:hypothetical protein
MYSFSFNDLNVKTSENRLTFSRTRPERGEYISDAAFTDSEKDKRLIYFFSILSEAHCLCSDSDTESSEVYNQGEQLA